MRIVSASILAAILCSGCSSLSSDQHARELADNRQDDEYCVEHGLHYPDPGYTQCRRQLVDRRLFRDWQNLRQMQRVNQPVAGPAPLSSPPFHGPDPASFHCRTEPQFDNDYVFCGYDGSAPNNN